MECGLVFVNAKLNEEYVKTLIFTGVTQNFLAKNDAKNMNIQYTKGIGWLKVVNALSKPIFGFAHEVTIKIGGQKRTIDLTIVPMDDYHIVLGMEFLNKVHLFSFKDNTMCITKGLKINIVPLEVSKMESRVLSTIKL